MRTVPSRHPKDVLNTLVASEIEVIRSRDPELSAALDVAPRPVEHEATRIPEQVQPGPSRTRRALRKAYRTLDRLGPLRPLLQRARTRVLDILEDSKKQSEAVATHTGITRSYTIAFTMRSGSNEICSLLARNGFGSPSEFFQKRLPAAQGLILDSFCRIVNRYQVGGIFGSKMSHDHYAALGEQLRQAIPQYGRIDDLLPNHRWVWLKRKDKILQAISWCRAEHSNVWASAQPKESSTREYRYDFFHVLSRIMMIYAAELAWETYFRENQIEPFVVIYEEFFRDLDGKLRELVAFLGGLPPGRTSIEKDATFVIQRNDQSYAIRERFIRDLTRMGSNALTAELGEPMEKWVHFFFEYGWRV